ncbi:MAG: hypothetical protein A2Y10_10110 [Planctomycetes bacterium GWF2_41_51]|nr:MAG: hypothetical protein A2Y10_10110 [Planctomycetes bacterium GWF2_41_51]HBG27707.1 hypothetical protein [Phycisphaerales bacterium]
MNTSEIKRQITIFDSASCTEHEYREFLTKSYGHLKECGNYFASDEDINSLELAHLIPEVPETVLAIYVGINDAVCNKGLVTPLLPQHGHNNVFVFDSQTYAGQKDVPAGTIDAKAVLAGFSPPNDTWDKNWTYVMIEDPVRTFESLWNEKGYIDMIPAKFEDFTMMTDHMKSKVCTFISPKAFEHPVNKSRSYLKAARNRGAKMVEMFRIPEAIKDEFEGLMPVVLNKGEKLYIATKDFGPCAHGWTNIHPDNEGLAVINENSAVPLDLVIAKPPVIQEYAKELMPAKGSADMTTDWFKRGQMIMRKPLLAGLFKG